MTPRARLAAAVGAAGFQFQPKWVEQPPFFATSAAPPPKTASRLQVKAVVPLDAPVNTQEVESPLTERAAKLKARKMQQARNTERGKPVEPFKSEPVLEGAPLVGSATATDQEVSQLPPTEPVSATPSTQGPPCPVEPQLSNGFPPDTSVRSDVVPLLDSTPPNWPETSCPESSAVHLAVADQEKAEETLEVPHAEPSAHADNESLRGGDSKNFNQRKWIRVSYGRCRVLKTVDIFL